MNKQHLLNLKSALIAFVAVWAVNETVLFHITQQQFPEFWWIIKLLSALGIFVFFYEVLSYALNSIIALKASPEGKIAGQWYQIFQINNYETQEPNDHIRFGKVSIDFHNGNLEISAQSTKTHDSATNSHWYSDQVSLRGQKLWLIFSSSGPGRGTTLGTMELHFQGSKPTTMSGAFNDSSPSKHYGNMEFYRSEDDYKTRLNQLLSNSHA